MNYFLKVELSEANPKLIDPFLAVKIETLPMKIRNKASAKQTEVAALVRLSHVKKESSSCRWTPATRAASSSR